jgi:hypothetical protein
MWRAAVIGRLAYFEHWTSGHAVSWNIASRTGSRCAGDIVCHDCRQVLWCRSHDPWRGMVHPPDHWGATPSTAPAVSPLDTLDEVLRLADASPPGVPGDELRRAACELIEAESHARRVACVSRMLAITARAERRHRRGRARSSDPSVTTLSALTAALTSERPFVGRTSE